MSERVKRWTDGDWFRATAEEHGRMFAGSVCANDSAGTTWVLFQGNSFLSPQERTANNHLIAAAPALVEALEAAIDCGMVPRSSAADGGASKYSRQVQVADQIRAALALAYGETQ